jgi:hypothetical protein
MNLKMALAGSAVALAAVAGGWWLLSGPKPPPNIRILGVGVIPVERNGGTRLHITTRYSNTGCTQILLARFLLNTRPTPSIALPQQQGPTVLPAKSTELIEDIDLNFTLGTGEWHLFSNAVCYSDGDPIPSAAVSPTALFDQG